MNRFRRAPVFQPVWLITLAVALASVLLFSFYLRDLPAISNGSDVPWWAIAGGMAVAESFVVHLHFRSESGTFSFFEIPLAVGLLFTEPGGVWVATVVGLSVALIIVRKQAPIKVLFNVANLSLHAGVAAVLMHVLSPADPLEPAAWPVLILAISVGGLVQILPLAGVINATEGMVRSRQMLALVTTGVAVSSVNTAQALIAILLVINEPFTVIPLAVTTTFVFVSYRAYLSERANRERVEFLYTSTKALRESPEADSAIISLLVEAASAFRATRVDLHLLPQGEIRTGTLFRYRIEDGSHERLDTLHPSALVLCEFGATPTLVSSARVPQGLKTFFEKENFRDAMIGTLRGTGAPLGVLVVGDRLGAVTSFTKADVQLFETLVDHAAIAFENNELESTLAEMQEVEQNLRHRAGHDTLTGLPNRATFNERLQECLHSEQGVVVLYVDLDDFKIVNDTLGHDVGDSVLVAAAERISSHIGEGDLAARLGGDEFAVILLDPPDATQVAQLMVEALHTTINVGPHEIHVGASIGVSTATTAADPAAVLREADTAMYEAKRNGKGSVVEFTEGLAGDASEVPILRTQLKLAVNQHQFELVYQPIVELSTGRIAGAEALVRWRSNGELLSPDRFMAEAEVSGLIVPIDHSVLEMAIDEIADLGNDERFFISVNVSPRSVESGEFSTKVAELLAGKGVSPQRLVIELSTASIPGLSAIAAEINDLRELGVLVALEDFGTLDYSLSLLREIPFDIAKIRVDHLLGDANEAYVRGLAAFSKAVGRKVIASRIERDAQLTEAASSGFDFGQGYLLGHPSTARVLVDRLEARSTLPRAS